MNEVEKFRDGSNQLLEARLAAGGELDELLRGAGVLDNKSGLMLTYLAILLAGISIFLAGGESAVTFGLPRAIFGLGIALLFGAVIASALLCFSCTIMIDVRKYRDIDQDELMTTMFTLMYHRVRRFMLAYWLTVAASVAFAALLFATILNQYFI